MVFVAAGNDGTATRGDPSLTRDPSPTPRPARAASWWARPATWTIPTTAATSRTAPRSPASAPPSRPHQPRADGPRHRLRSRRRQHGRGLRVRCRTNDNNQTNPVECDLVDGILGTSFSAPAAAGSALLVRDWFAQGFYPDGTSTNPANAGDQVANISGALLKAVLVTSADWLEGGEAWAATHFQAFRFNREQGYGRISSEQRAASEHLLRQPDRDDHLGRRSARRRPRRHQRYPREAAPPRARPRPGRSASTATRRSLRCALAWVEDRRGRAGPRSRPGDGRALGHGLLRELLHRGRGPRRNPGRRRELLGPRPRANTLDEDIWSIETNACGAIAGSRRDTRQPRGGDLPLPTTWRTESRTIRTRPASTRNRARRLDAARDLPDGCGQPAVRRQLLRPGRQRLLGSPRPGRIRLLGPGQGHGQRVHRRPRRGTQCGGSRVADDGAGHRRRRNGVYENGGGDDIVRDSETGAAVLAFTATGQRYESADLTLTDGTAYDPGNGALDVRNGNRIKVIYADESSGSPDANKLRFNSATVDCQTRVSIGGVVWATFGKDAATLVNGGCERDARNLFTFGFPDKYMDAGELINYRIDFQSLEATEDLIDAVVTLRCVKADADSPATCLPGGSRRCADPNRTNNPACTEMTILDSPMVHQQDPGGRSVSANFNISMAGAVTGTPKVDMLLGVTAKKAGKSVESLIVSRHVLDVDEASVFYSTDFPTGGNETRDYNENETVQVVTTNTGDFTGTTCSRLGPTATSRPVAPRTPDCRLRGTSTPTTAPSALASTPEHGPGRPGRGQLGRGQELQQPARSRRGSRAGALRAAAERSMRAGTPAAAAGGRPGGPTPPVASGTPAASTSPAWPAVRSASWWTPWWAPTACWVSGKC